MWLSIQISNNKKGRELAKFLKTIEYIDAVNVEDTVIPLKEEYWIKPGRHATDEELEQLATEMENEKGGLESRKFFSDLKKKLPSIKLNE